MNRFRMLVRKFELNLHLKETDLGVSQAYLIPKRFHLNGINVLLAAVQERSPH